MNAVEPVLTLLYVPGDRPERFGKALASGADVVIVDLEDAVAPGRKADARASVCELLGTPPAPPAPPVQVRINGAGTPWHEDDLDALTPLPGFTGLRLPKAESPEQVARIATRVVPDGSVRLHLLVESARGVEAAAELAAAHPLVSSIALGEADLCSELGVTGDAGLAWVRGRIVVAAAATGLPPPAMSVYPDVADAAGLATSCREGRALGFLGRAAIHPRQLPVIEAAFLPDDREIEEAEATLTALRDADAQGRGTAVLPGGRFVDRAMAERARRVLSLAARRTATAPPAR